MKDDNQENRPRMRLFRNAVFSLAALVVLSLGFVLIPAEPPPPAEPPFSEQARESAYEDTMELRAAALQLAASGAGTGPAAGTLDRVVTLLTLHARALLLTDAGPAPTSASPLASSTPPASAAPSLTPVGLAQALAASAMQRLSDAETADGGMARLLGGAGTAQLLAAEELAAAAGEPGAVQSEIHGATTAQASPAATGSCPTTAAATAATGATPGAALAAVVVAEQEMIYAYQAALTRLAPAQAGPASEFLALHQDLAGEAESFSRSHCAMPPPQAPGFVLESGFLEAPGAGLARLEADTLPAYGDLVALTADETRSWALAAIQSAARRALGWGGSPGPLPGLSVTEQDLPPLPE